jgi:hypothetical protein
VNAPRRLATFLAGVLCLIALASCGGGGSGTTTAATEEGGGDAAGAAIKQANANCRTMLGDIQQIAKRAKRGGYGTSFAMVTEGLAKPATRLIKQVAERQRALKRAADNSRFDLYVHFFDPIIVLAEERVRAGQAEDTARSEQLQYLLVNLGDEQRLAARRAGLRDCEVDFFGAMVQASGG